MSISFAFRKGRCEVKRRGMGGGGLEVLPDDVASYFFLFKATLLISDLSPGKQLITSFSAYWTTRGAISHKKQYHV